MPPQQSQYQPYSNGYATMSTQPSHPTQPSNPTQPVQPTNQTQSSMPPQSPSQVSEINEDIMFNLPGPTPISRISGKYAWALEIVQQPVRARMCGFGDKDRRPISPPPCIRLIIMDLETGKEVDYSKFTEQLSKFVLHVDLCAAEIPEDKNLVRHTSSSPSISSVGTSTYPMTSTNTQPSQSPLAQYNINNISAYNGQTFTGPPPNSNHISSNTNGSTHPTYYTNGTQQPQPYYANGAPQYGRPAAYQYGEHRYPNNHHHHHHHHHPNGYPQMPPHMPHMPPSDQMRHGGQHSVGPLPEQKGMFTRNLIGSLAASAFKLENLDGKLGLYFVFQDLSIRTEGWFRLKCCFFDIGDHSKLEEQDPSKLAELAPLLAMVYSKPFRVYSAKRFPGVIESTDLSKKFATQGIKIPIRKDTNAGGKRRRDDDSDADDQDDDE